jgi:hypothetical protein
MFTTASIALGTVAGLQFAAVAHNWDALVVVLIQLVCACSSPIVPLITNRTIAKKKERSSFFISYYI